MQKNRKFYDSGYSFLRIRRTYNNQFGLLVFQVLWNLIRIRQVYNNQFGLLVF